MRIHLSLLVLLTSATLWSAPVIPLLQEVDVLVLGGTAAAVEAALAAKATGARTLLVAPKPYLGEEIAGTLDLRLSTTIKPATPLAQKLYSKTVALDNGTRAIEPRPLEVKKLLDQALLDADIPFLTASPATELLIDGAGRVAGAAIANRSGRQAIVAPCVIDATVRGSLARANGAVGAQFTGGTIPFTRFVIAAEPPPSLNCRVEELPGPCGFVTPEGKEQKMPCRLFRCTKEYRLENLTPATLAAIEQDMRDCTYTPQMLDASDRLAFLPPDLVLPSRAGLFCAGPYAAPNTLVAKQMQEPALAMARAATIGKQAGEAAQSLPPPQQVRVQPRKGKSLLRPGERIFQPKDEIRISHFAREKGRTVVDAPDALADFGSFDVVVAGLGTSGAPAAIAAAREGLKVLACDCLHTMGGVMTAGLIGHYWFGNRVGFTAEVDAGVKTAGEVKAVAKAEWFRRELRKAGGTIWFGAMVNGIVKRGDVLTGVIVVMPDGERGLVRVRAAIDATGNADLAAMAGEDTEFIGERELSLQGTGLARRNLQTSYANCDIGFADETDAGDLALFALRTRLSLSNDWDVAQIVNSRERRRLRGVFYVTPQDILLQRTYPDTIVQPMSNFDSHGQTDHDIFFLMDCGHQPLAANFPYRALLPKKTDGLLVLGLGASAHRDAMPVLRMQPDLQNQGYAAGLAAAQAIGANLPLRKVDIRALQRKLAIKGILATNVLHECDSFPLSDAHLRNAAKKAVLLPQDNRKEERDQSGRYGKPLSKDEIKARREIYLAAAALFTDPARAIPLLQEEFRSQTHPERRLAAAELLAMLGDATGADLLVRELQTASWDAGWNYRGMGQFGRSLSRLDGIIWALAKCRHAPAIPAIIDKAKALSPDSDYSHFRAVCLALSRLQAKQAAPVLAALLSHPDISGHALAFNRGLPPIPQYERYENKPSDRERSLVLRELALLAALHRLGDHNRLAHAGLTAYAQDPRGPYARFAQQLLAEKPSN